MKLRQHEFVCLTLSCTSNQVTYTPSALHLSNREIYPNLWQTYPLESHLSSPLTATMKQFNWTQVKIITQNEAFFLQVFTIVPLHPSYIRSVVFVHSGSYPVCDWWLQHVCVHYVKSNLLYLIYTAQIHLHGMLVALSDNWSPQTQLNGSQDTAL